MKNKCKLTLPVILLSCSVLIAQVGINNSSPQQVLHVSGTSTGTSQSIVRIDGLNNSQNTAHESATSVKRVFATANGDLVILDNNQTNKYYTSPTFTTTPIPGGTEQPVVSYTFILDYPSVVHVDARVAATITSLVAAIPVLRNGQARAFGSYYKFTSAPSGVATNVTFGDSSVTHSTSGSAAANQLSGEFTLEPRKDLYLPKGNYTIVLYGFSRDTDLDFAINNFGSPTQKLHFSSTPVTY